MSPSPVPALVPETPVKSMSKSTEEWAAVEELRERLASRKLIEDWKLKSDNFILRYLRANRFNVDKAEKMLEDYADSLKEQNYTQLVKESFPQDFTDKFEAFVGGEDNQGRPIVMIPHGGLWNLKEAIQSGREELFIRYVFKVTSILEKLVIERDCDYGMLICDLSNIAYANYFHKRSLEVILYLARMMEKIAPGLIGKVYLVNASKLCVTLFNTIQRLVTLSCNVITMDSNEEKWRGVLKELIPKKGICPHFGGVLKSYVTA